MKQPQGPLDRAQTRQWINRQRMQTARWTWGVFAVLQAVFFVVAGAFAGAWNREVLVFTGGFLVLSLGLTVYAWRRSGASWRGEVVDKRRRKIRVPTYADHSEQIRTVYQVFCRTPRGKRMKVRTRKAYSDYLKPGDRVVKVPGFYYPEKEQPDGEQRACIGCGNIFAATAGNCPACGSPLPDVEALGELVRS
jgi:hypothetical protein